MFKRIVCLLFICSLIGCEKEIFLPEKHTPTVAAKGGGNDNTDVGSDSTGDGGINSGGSTSLGDIGVPSDHLGSYVSEMHITIPIMNVTNMSSVPCMENIPFFIEGDALIQGSVTESEHYTANLSFNLNSAFTSIDFDVVAIEWEVNGNTNFGQNLYINSLLEEEVVSVVCSVYTTDGYDVYLSVMEFDIYVVDNGIGELPVNSNGTAINYNYGWWEGVHLVFHGELRANGLCGSGEGTFAIIVPFAGEP